MLDNPTSSLRNLGIKPNPLKKQRNQEVMRGKKVESHISTFLKKMMIFSSTQDW
jgi:hypothetical protein